MLLALHPVDYAVLTLLVVVLVTIGVAVRRTHAGVAEFLLAGRSLAAIPAGVSLTATLVPAFCAVGSMLVGLSLIGLPGQAYDVGLKPLVIPLAMWLTVPLVWRYVLPLYQGLRLTSVYEYLELRFDRKTRHLASCVFLVWRTTWVVGVLALGCQVLVAGAGLRIPAWLLIVLLGAVTTSYTYLGGMKAVAWAETIQLAVILSAATAVMLSIWAALDGGAGQVWSVAESLGRNRILPPGAGGRATWQEWGFVPHAALALLTFFVADQVTVQRLLAVQDVKAARRAFMAGCTSLTIVVLLLTYLGLGLLAFYHDHSAQLRAKWVVNVDPATRQSLPLASGLPALPWDDPRARVDASTIQALVDQRRIIRPNSRDAIDDAAPLLDPLGPEGLRVPSLLTRYPPKAGSHLGEAVLHARANEELLPWYITTQLPWGLAGLAVAAVFAAIMSSVDSGLLGLSGIVATYAAGAGDGDSSPASRDRRVPLVVLGVGIAVTIGALAAAPAPVFMRLLITVTGTLGGPLLAVFLLGIWTKRTSPMGARIGLVAGILLTAWLTCSNSMASFAWAWPFSQTVGAGWALTMGVALSLVSGYAASLVTGDRGTARQLRGLVWGQGRLGQRDEEIVPKIKLPGSKRWK